MDTITSLKAQLVPLAPQVSQIKAVFALIAAKQPVGLEHAHVVSVITRSEYVRFSSRAGRLMFTEKGTKFYRQMRKFG